MSEQSPHIEKLNLLYVIVGGNILFSSLRKRYLLVNIKTKTQSKAVTEAVMGPFFKKTLKVNISQPSIFHGHQFVIIVLIACLSYILYYHM